LRQLTKAVINLDLPLRLAQRGWRAKGFRDGLSVPFAGQTKMGTVSGMMGLMAVTVGLAAGAPRGSNRSAAEIGQPNHFLEDAAALLL
jgi:hypothetical protein